MPKKKAMHAPRNKGNVVVVEGPNNSYDSALADLLEDAQLDLGFFPPVDINAVGKVLELYSGREVYVTEQTSKRPVFYRGILETKVEKERTYRIRLLKAPNFPNEHYYSRLRRMIVAR